MARDVKVMVRLTEPIKDQLQQLAEAKGLTMSAYVAYLVGEHLYQQKNYVLPMLTQLSNSFSSSLQQRVQDESEASLDTGGEPR